jgi:hypothetical protein
VIQREFYKLGEVEKILDVDAETMRQTLLRRAIPAYLEVRGLTCFYSTWGGKPLRSGSTQYSRWNMVRDGTREDHPRYYLSGWFRLIRSEDLRGALEREVFGVFPALWPCDLETIEPDDAPPSAVDAFSVDNAEIPNNFSNPSLRELWFRKADIDAMRQGTSPGGKTPDKPLDERERGSLLRIIRALDVMAKLPERGAAPSVEAQLQSLGFSRPGDSTIRKVIEQARALEPDEKPQ